MQNKKKTKGKGHKVLTPTQMLQRLPIALAQFKVKNGYSLELLKSETMKLLGSNENKITKDKNGENVPHLEIAEVVFVHCNIVNNDYQQDSGVLYTFVPNKPFGSLLEISPTNHIF